MRKVFLDTNIVVDLIGDRKPFSKYAIEIFKLAEEKKLDVFTSSHSIATTHYLLKKYLDEKSLREVLYNLLDFVTVIPVDVDIIKKGLRSSHKDFEDSIQIFCASSITIEVVSIESSFEQEVRIIRDKRNNLMIFFDIIDWF